MGGHGQPEGRPSRPDEGRDSNHPQGTDKRAGLPGVPDIDTDHDD